MVVAAWGQASPPPSPDKPPPPDEAPPAAKPAAVKGGWSPARTPWGQPDLRGIWDFQSVTPLERPAEFAGKEVVSDT